MVSRFVMFSTSLQKVIEDFKKVYSGLWFLKDLEGLYTLRTTLIPVTVISFET